MTMLAYVEMILEKVSFDKKLFEKELVKGIKQLVPNDVVALRQWCYDRFGKVYMKILNKIFNSIQFA